MNNLNKGGRNKITSSYSSVIYKYVKKSFGMASFHSKYVIIGTGFAGVTLSRLLTYVCYLYNIN